MRFPLRLYPVGVLLLVLLLPLSCTTSRPANEAETSGSTSFAFPNAVEGRWTTGPSRAVATQGNWAYLGMGGALQIVDVSTPHQPTTVERVQVPALVQDVSLSGHYAYVTYQNGLGVIDVSDPTTPEAIATVDLDSRTPALTISNERAYVSTTSGVQVIDVSSPAAPTTSHALELEDQVVAFSATSEYTYVLTGRSPRAGKTVTVFDVSAAGPPQRTGAFSLDDYTADLVVKRGVAYLGGEEGITVMDVSEPAAPESLASLDGGGASHLTVKGDQLYFDARGLGIADISDPSTPQRTGTASVGSSHDVAIGQNYAYLAQDTKGLRTVNVSDANTPREIGALSHGENPRSLAVKDGYAYASVMFDGLIVTDVSNPARPQRVDTVNIGVNGGEVAFHETYAYVADRQSLTVLDIANPTDPQPLDTVAIEGARNVAVANGRAFVGQDSTVTVFDLSSPGHPNQVGTLSAGERIWDMEAQNDHLYLAADSLEIFDVSTPAEGTSLSAVSLKNAPEIQLAIDDGLAYVVHGFGGRVFDVSDPAHPTPRGTFGNATGIAAQNNRLYLTGSTGLHVLDMTNPSRPRTLGHADAPGPEFVATTGNHAFVLGQHLRAVDVSDPTAPRQPGTVPASHGARAVALTDTHAFVASDGLRVLDRSAPTRLQEVATLYNTNPRETQGRAARSLLLRDQHVYLGYRNAIRIIDVTTPDQPQKLGSVGTSRSLSGFAVADNHLYVAAGQASFSVTDVSVPDEPEETTTVETGGRAHDVAVSGQHAFVAAGTALEVFDRSSPGEPKQIGSLSITSREFLSNVAANENYAYTSGDGSLQVVDITRPEAPETVAELKVGPVEQLIASNERVYLTKPRGEGIRVVNVSTPPNPKQVGSLDLSTTELAVGADYMYAAGGRAGLAGLYVIAPSELPAPSAGASTSNR